MSQDVPEALADAVRRAAAAVPATPADLSGLRRRYRRRRRRRVAATAGLAAVVVGATASTAPLLAPRGGTGTPGGGSPSAPAASSQGAPRVSVPSQRLMLAQDRGQPDRAVGEILSDGTMVFRPVSGVDSADRVVPLPDGRLVVLGPLDLTPGVIEQPDGPNNPAVGFMLVVQRDDGTVELSRDVRVIGEDVPLLGATGREAYLLRPTGVVAHDFATGQERPVLSAGAIPNGYSTRRAVDVTAGRIAFATAACRVHLFDLGTGAPVTVLAPPPTCTAPGEVRLSPDGRLAAFSYSVGSMHDPRHPIQTRLAVLDVATGATRLDTLLFESVWETAEGNGASMFGTRPYYLRGSAWLTARSLRLAITHNGVTSVQTVTVP